MSFTRNFRGSYYDDPKDSSIEFSQDIPTGETFSFCINGDTAEEIAENICKYAIILNALVHFDIGQLNRGTEWFPALFRYSTNENVFPINNLMKVKSIKLFKNGRVDIKFKDAVSVLEFVESYLRKRFG